MAFQDFVDGGFIGKLGNLIGQKRGTQRIVYAYFKPANPRTPLQQSGRAQFAIASRLAQEAFNLNKGDASWRPLPGFEFSNRVGTARRRLIAGASEAQALPLYPDGYTPQILLQPISIRTYNDDEIENEYAAPPSLAAGYYEGSAAVRYFSATSRAWRSDIFHSVATDYTGSGTFSFIVNTSEPFIDGSPCYMEAVLYLDGNSGSTPVTCPRITLGDTSTLQFSVPSFVAMSGTYDMLMYTDPPKETTLVLNSVLTIFYKEPLGGSWKTGTLTTMTFNAALYPGALRVTFPPCDIAAGQWVEGFYWLASSPETGIFILDRVTNNNPPSGFQSRQSKKS